MSKIFGKLKLVAPTDSGVRRAAVIGKPIEHSLSPVVHNAAFNAVGLTEWSYGRHEVDAHEVADFVRGLGPEWAGLSVTMPDKRAALECASEVTPWAEKVGAANTLTPLASGGWLADCTDVAGIVGALRAVNGVESFAGSALILGAGSTAAAAVVACAELGMDNVYLLVREAKRATTALQAAERAGIPVQVQSFSTADFSDLAHAAPVVISTVPSSALEPYAMELSAAHYFLDVIYSPWPTPIAKMMLAQGKNVATGLDMLLHQAFGQSELFTGRPAPKQAMRDALHEASGKIVPLPF